MENAGFGNPHVTLGGSSNAEQSAGICALTEQRIPSYADSVLAVVFACVRHEYIFCVVFFLPGHVNRFIESREVGFVIYNRLRLLVL